MMITWVKEKQKSLQWFESIKIVMAGIFAFSGLYAQQAQATGPSAFTLASEPLYLAGNPTPNVLLAMDSSFSMLNDINDVSYVGGKLGKAATAAKAAAWFVNENKNKINLGLMNYKYNGANLALIYGDYDKDDYSGVTNSINVQPFRLTPYPAGVGIAAAPYDTPGVASSGKSKYRFAPGELIHYRYVLVNRGPEKAINPRLELMLPPHLVLSGYNTSTGQYSGFKTKMSQHAGENWTCHSPAGSLKVSSLSNPAGQTPALDQRVYCDTPEINNRETVLLEFYAYWTGYGAGGVLPINASIADSQCETSTACNASFTPRDPVGNTIYNGLYRNNAPFTGVYPGVQGVGMRSQYSKGEVGSPSRIKTYMWLTNYSGSTYNKTLKFNMLVDTPSTISGAAHPTTTGNRLVAVSGQEVTYSTSCGNLSNPACYTTKASSGWSCAPSDYSAVSPAGYRGMTCDRTSGMPVTDAGNSLTTSEVIEVIMETTPGNDLTLANVGSILRFSSILTSPSDTAHDLDPGYVGGAGFGAIGPQNSLGSCTNYVAVQSYTASPKSDGFSAPATPVVDFYGPAPAYCFGTVSEDGLASSAQSLPAFSNYATPGVGYLRSPISPLNESKVIDFLGPDKSLSVESGKQGKLYPYSPEDDSTSLRYGTDSYDPATGTFTSYNQGTSFMYETPLAGTILTGKRYFSQTLTADENGTGLPLASINSVGNKYPQLPASPCNRNYMILLTDGNPTIDVSGNKYPDLDTATLDTMAKAKELYDAGITLYVIALGNGADISRANSIAQAGSGGSCTGLTCTGGTLAYSATGYSSLKSAFSSITSKFLPKATSAQVSLMGPTGLSLNDIVVTASFSPDQWFGSLVGYLPTVIKGGGAPGEYFNPSSKLMTSQNYFTGEANLKRNFFTAKRPSPSRGDAAGVSKGIVLNWPANPAAPSSQEMNPWQSEALNTNEAGVLDAQGSLRLNWLKGDVSNESLSDPGFRTRSSHLGDIINSSPLVVGAPNNSIITEASYASFRAAQKNRMGMIYVGANDGFFHGFRLFSGTSVVEERLNEKFAFMPSFVYPRLSQLMRQDYSANHVYTVDGTPVSGDVFFNGDSSWRTLVVSGVGAGGRGYFALDVTNPGNEDSNVRSGTCASVPATCKAMEESDTNANKLLLWEFTAENSHSGTIDPSGLPSGIVTGDKDLGFTFSKPLVTNILMGSAAPYTKTPVVIFGNGYNNTDSTMGPASTTGQAALYIVNAETGYLIRKITVPGGSASVPNGLGSVLGIDVDHDGRTDRVYAADLLGRVWRFNLYSGSARAASDFEIAFGGQPFYTATDGSGNPRSITGEIRAAFHPKKGYMIMFGSGQYLAKTDVKDTSTPYTSVDGDAFYSIWDRDESTAIPSSPEPRDYLNGVSTTNCQRQVTVGDTTAGDNTCLSVADAYASANTYIKVEPKSTPKPYCGDGVSPSGSCVMGCYLEFKNIPVAGYNGERFIYSPVIGGKTVQVNSIIPPQNLCSFTDAGVTTQYFIDYMNCTALTKTPYDINKDGKFSSLDVLMGVDGQAFNPAGQLVSGLTPPAARDTSFNGPTALYELSSINQGMPVDNYVNITTSGGRISWREMQPHLINPKPTSPEGFSPGH